MKINKEIYNYRVKEGAYRKMMSILKYPEQALAIKENCLCCITGYAPVNDDFIRDVSVIRSSSELYQVRAHGETMGYEALILRELLEEVPITEWIIIDKSA